ncbi:MAG: ABC transporter permease [Kiritimatiellae bacterium]|nr:ABC transporter permease [Kiritimatiellia bacterium]
MIHLENLHPILYLDLRQRQRQRSLLVLALLALALPALVILLGTFIDFSFADLARCSPDTRGDALFYITFGFQAAILLVLAPLGAADRISREREQRTLTALMNSPATAGSILWGKLLGAWAFDAWLWSLTLPIPAIGSMWGGIPFGRCLFHSATLLLAGLLLSTVAIACSACSGRTLHAYLRLGAVYLVWFLLCPVLMGILDTTPDSANLGARMVSFLLLAHNPFAPAIYLLLTWNLPTPLLFPYNAAFLPLAALLWLLILLPILRRSLRALRSLI